MRFKKATALFLAAALLSTAMAPFAMAASRKKVGKIYLTVDTDIRVGNSGGAVDVTATGDNADLYYIDAVEVTNEEVDNWRSSSAPEVEIVLGVNDEEEYYFSNTSSSNFKLTMDSSIKSRFDKLEFVSARRDDDNATLILKIRLIFDKDKYNDSAIAPSGLEWSSSLPGTGTWGDVPSAKYFQIQLFKDGEALSDILSSYNTSYDFTSLITEAGSYTFKVRSVKSGSNVKSSWATSGRLTVEAEDITAGGLILSPNEGASSDSPNEDGSWQKAADNVRWWWRNPDGSYPVSSWKAIGGQWYYFDAEGYMATGWIELDGLHYYLDPATGAMYANTRTPDNYWVNESGAWVPGM